MGELYDSGILVDQKGFSFLYGGQHSNALLDDWDLEVDERQIDDDRYERIRTYTDSETGLEVRFESVVYTRFPAIEWVLTFKNLGEHDTSILESIQALDLCVSVPAADKALLHHSQGSLCNDRDFMPYTTALPEGQSKTLGTRGGRSSQDSLPFFNLEYGSRGLIVAVGWSGQWVATVSRGRDGDESVRLRAGMERTHLKLYPGESIRSPRIVLHGWKDGDWLEGQNSFRRFMRAYHHPQSQGKPVVPPIASCGSHTFAEATLHDEENAIGLIKAFDKYGIKTEAFWMDAGWYSRKPAPDWWSEVGTWEPDPRRFPRGLQPISEVAQEMGMGFILWFEPERVGPDTQIAREHPEWVWPGEPWGLFKLGDPEACHWLADYLVDFVQKHGITIYRQDFNMDPLDYWRRNEPDDRQGINEIRHIENLYRFWDTLLERVPGLVIDNCASGGRRLDLETMSRSVALWRTDAFASISGIHTMLNLYSSGHSTGVLTGDRYDDRIRFAPGVNVILQWDVETWTPKFDVSKVKARLEEFHELRFLWFGDFHPLTPVTDQDTDWLAYQIARPDLGRGAVVAFRRPESPYRTVELKLRGILPGTQYRVTYKDCLLDGVPLVEEKSGEELGVLLITIESQRDSALIIYEAVTK